MKIFLSYASEDRHTAEQIQLALAAEGHRVFYDRRGLPPGSDFHGRIRNAVRESDQFIFLISPESVTRGRYTLTELKYARDKWPHPRDGVLPVLLTPTPWEHIPDYVKAVTLLEPEGNIAAEVVAHVEALSEEPELQKGRTSFYNLSKASKADIAELMESYKKKISRNREDAEANYNLALCYLHLNRYRLAAEHFQRSLASGLGDADAYYYCGLSLIGGRRPKTLSLKDVRTIEEYLEAAIQMDEHQAKYYYLAAILKYDYYLANGLSIDPPTPDELIELAYQKDHDLWETERLLRAVTLRDEVLISRIRRQ